MRLDMPSSLLKIISKIPQIVVSFNISLYTYNVIYLFFTVCGTFLNRLRI